MEITSLIRLYGAGPIPPPVGTYCVEVDLDSADFNAVILLVIGITYNSQYNSEWGEGGRRREIIGERENGMRRGRRKSCCLLMEGWQSHSLASSQSWEEA